MVQNTFCIGEYRNFELREVAAEVLTHTYFPFLTHVNM